jgi:hypothetical protein
MIPLRTLHAYVGMFIAPTVLFMAATGALQVYSLHEAHGDYHPPRFFEQLGSVHKDQVIRSKSGHDEDADEDHDHDHDHAAPAKAPPQKGPPAKGDHDHAGKKSNLAVALLKVFFAATAVGLIASTSIGIWMGLKPPLRRRTHIILLALGTVIPLALALMTAG